MKFLPAVAYKAAARGGESGLVHRCCPSVCLFVSRSVCLSPKCKKRDFKLRAMVSIDDLQCIESCTWAFQRTHYWTHKIQDG